MKQIIYTLHEEVGEDDGGSEIALGVFPECVGSCFWEGSTSSGSCEWFPATFARILARASYLLRVRRNQNSVIDRARQGP